MRKSATIGRVFGRLTVIDRGPDAGSDRTFECRCECGAMVTVRKTHLYGGRQRSCGCLKREMVTAKNLVHGHSVGKKTTPEFRAWCAMRSRCYSPTNEKYPIYGGRGIAVCDEWRDDFQAFFDCVGPKPERRFSLDRIDVNGNYEPGNVRWATPTEQRLNQRRMIAA